MWSRGLAQPASVSPRLMGGRNGGLWGRQRIKSLTSFSLNQSMRGIRTMAVILACSSAITVSACSHGDDTDEARNRAPVLPGKPPPKDLPGKQGVGDRPSRIRGGLRLA